MRRLASLGLVFLLVLSLAAVSAEAAQKSEYRFVVIPKVVHPWFDAVVEGAREQAAFLEEQTGARFIIEYRAPSTADVVIQNQILEQAAATRPDGIMIDLLDAAGNTAVLESVLDFGIPVVIFDSEAPEDLGLTSVGNDFAEQARIAADRLAELLDGEGQVAIMRGFPTAPNHHIRYLAHVEALSKYPGIEIVAEGIDNDDIETAQKQAASILAAHPDLDGFLACDAAGPIGIGLAIREAGLTGQVLHVGMDDLPQIVELVGEGVIESSSSTKPKMQGAWSVMALWMQANGLPTPKRIDTGIALVTQDNVHEYEMQ